VAQADEHLRVRACRRLGDERSELSVRFDAARADELVGTLEQRLFRCIAANGCERRKLVECV